jgi:hypothetical protein
MGSPFPGVDPFLEGQGVWHDFHVSFNVCLREKLMQLLPDNYIARIEEHVYFDDDSGTAISRTVPDVEVEQIAVTQHPMVGVGKGVVATLEPVVVPNRFFDPTKVRYIEVRTREEGHVVTVIETLSPTNKSGSGRSEYLAKRLALMYEDLNLVELDLLLRGRRIEMGGPIPAGDFYAMISRGDRRPNCEIYAWGLTDSLPRIPIPLKSPDPDVIIDLQEVFSITFDRGPYNRLVRYRRPIGLTLPDTMARWVEERINDLPR